MTPLAIKSQHTYQAQNYNTSGLSISVKQVKLAATKQQTQKGYLARKRNLLFFTVAYTIIISAVIFFLV